MRFQNILTLGTACKTRHQVNRVLKASGNGGLIKSLYFDWLWGAGLSGVNRAFEHCLVINPDNIDVEKAGGTLQARDAWSKFYFLHDFVFSDSVLLEFDLEAARIEMANQMPKFLEKYKYLAEKTTAVVESNEPLLCIYHGVSTSEERALFLAFMRAKRGDSDFLFVNVIPSDSGSEVLHSGHAAESELAVTVNDESVAGQQGEWKGCDSSWSAVLELIFRQ